MMSEKSWMMVMSLFCRNECTELDYESRCGDRDGGSRR